MGYTNTAGDQLSRVIEELRYMLQQSGGSLIRVQAGGGGFGGGLVGAKELVKAIFVLAFYLLIAYIVFLILTKRYMRAGMDVVSLGFYNTVNLDRMLTEQDFLVNHYKFMVKPGEDFEGIAPYKLFDDLIQGQGMETRLKDLDNLIQKWYPQLRYNRRYYKAFKEIFLFHESFSSTPKEFMVYLDPKQFDDPNYKPPTTKASLVETDFVVAPNQKTLPSQVPAPAPPYYVDYSQFYQTLVEYQIKEGEYKVRGSTVANQYKNNFDRKVAEAQYFDTTPKDKALKTRHFERIFTLRDSFDKARIAVQKAKKALDASPFTHFIIIPESDRTIKDFNYDYSKNFYRVLGSQKGDQVVSSKENATSIYDDSFPFESASEFSWYMFEVLSKNSYDTLSSQLSALQSELGTNTRNEYQIFLTTYLNMDTKERQRAERTIVISNPNIHKNRGVLDFVNKHPIFARIRFNSKVTDKAGTYAKAMAAYDHLMFKTKKEDISRTDRNAGQRIAQNLATNGRHLKDIINAVNVLDLYFNGYQAEMTKLYMEQHRSNVKFFKELWTPYFEQIWNMRIMEYYRRMLTKNNTSRSYSRFLKLWKMVGVMVQRLKQEIKKAFKRGLKVPDPEPAPQDDSKASG